MKDLHHWYGQQVNLGQPLIQSNGKQLYISKLAGSLNPWSWRFTKSTSDRRLYIPLQLLSPTFKFRDWRLQKVCTQLVCNLNAIMSCNLLFSFECSKFRGCCRFPQPVCEIYHWQETHASGLYPQSNCIQGSCAFFCPS